MSRKGTLAVTVIVLLVFAALVTVAWRLAEHAGAQPGSQGGAARAHDAVRYHCPMHPTIVADAPGECPICHMSLVPIEPEDEPAAEEQPAGVRGLAAVHLTPQKQQLIGVKTTPVARVPFERVVRATGRVTYDETRLHHAHTKVGGWVERLNANTTGELVRQGQPLLELYSPELLAAQQDYIVALKNRERTAESTLPAVAASGEELVQSARRRLRLLDLTDEQIDELGHFGEAPRTTIVEAPISGTIVERLVTQGQRIEADNDLLTIADLSRVWVVAAVYEYELPFVREGQRASVTLAYLPGKTFEGRVARVLPVLDAVSRSAEVRIELANPALELKPEMYAEVELHADLGERLAVPESAVLETGTRSVVFVDRGGGHFEPHEVEIGLRLPEAYEVLSGLAAGESVITSANFFVDSESKLKAALAAMREPKGGPATRPAEAEHRH